MSSYVVDVELQVKVDKMIGELQKIPGVSSREAKKMAGVWSREYKQTEKAAQRAAREAERQAERVREGWKSAAERTASLMGGVFGDISDSVLDLGDRFATLSSDMGGASGAMVAVTGIAAGLAAAAGFAAYSFVEWMDTIDETRASLENVYGLPPLSPEHEAALDGYMEATRDADAMLAQATLTLQAEFSPAMTEAKLAIVGMVSILNDLTGTVGGISGAFESFQGWMETINPAVYLYNQAIGAAAERGEELAESIDHIGDAMEDAGFVDYGPSIDLFEKSTKRAASTTRDMGKAAEEAGDDVVDMLVKSLDARVAYETKLQEQKLAEEAAKEAEKERFDELARQWNRVSEEALAYARALDEHVTQSQLHALETLKDATLDFVEGAAQNKIDALTNEEHAARNLHRKELDRLETEREAVQQELKAGKISEEQAKDRLKEIDAEEKARRKARRSERKEAKKALLDAHKASQAAARARAIIDAAANAVALTAAFAYLGPGAPAAAALVAAGQLTVQLGAIRNTKPPKFATGGMVRDRIEGDHAVISASPDEAILTPRGVDSAGGPEGVDALNRGTARSGSGSTRVYLDGRMLGEVVARVIESDRQVGAALDRRIGAVAGIAR